MNSSWKLQFRLCDSSGHFLGLVVAILIFIAGCDSFSKWSHQVREPGPKDLSVAPEMLIGAQYRGRTGGDEYDDMTWHFDETHFRIVAGEAGMPADLARAMLPDNVSGNQIDGRWHVEGEVLTVRELAVDSRPIDQPARTLTAMCTPVIRIQADSHQYMFFRGTTLPASRGGGS